MLILCILLPATSASSETLSESDVNEQYRNARFYLNQLQSESKGGTTREQWLRGARNFRLVYLSHPRSDLAPRCLFMLARVHRQMFTIFHKKRDLKETITYYKDVIRLFSASNLADDACYALSDLYMKQKHDPKKAGDYLRRIVEQYPQGDMIPRAEARLKQLSLDFDIPLPQVMISPRGDSSQLNAMRPVKYWSSSNYTRVIISGTNPVNYRTRNLPATAQQPARLVIDFANSYIEPRYRRPVPIKNGLLRQVRTGQFTPDTVRVVLDIDSIDDYDIFSLPDPYRVVIDVHGKATELPRQVPTGNIRLADETGVSAQNIQVIHPVNHKIRYAAAKGKTTAEARNPPVNIPVLHDTKKRMYEYSSAGFHSKPVFSLAQQFGLGIKKIIIDPGHGGKDPGAMAFGLQEKDIVLQLAKKLAPILEKELNCEVILTRSDDIFIPLEERTAVANTNGHTDADLFISLHVNAHESASITGIETYYLNLTRDPEAMRVAAKENATTTHQMNDLQELLSNIMKNSKILESKRLAETVQRAVIEGEKKRGVTIKDLGVKQAPFVVLIGAKMPAILIEAGFISNRKDSKNMTNPAWLESLAQEIASGIKSYTQSIKAVK
nr:N-acetylmuramoyl-L-alanine amidase [Desulforhopalus vacuolatus]